LSAADCSSRKSEMLDEALACPSVVVVCVKFCKFGTDAINRLRS
jgi:hypothetical protein